MLVHHCRRRPCSKKNDTVSSQSSPHASDVASVFRLLAHPSAATCSYNSLLLSLRSLTSEALYPFPFAPKTGHL